MGKPQLLEAIAPQMDFNETFGYPSTSVVIPLGGNENGQVHLILGTDTSPATNHAKAPNGSIYIPFKAVGADSKIWVKYSATGFGAADGTWAATAALT